jgi:PhnB protein
MPKTLIVPHLHIDSKTKEAMTFYQSIFGGELFFQTVEESPMKDQMPKENWKKIMHSSLTVDGEIVLMAVDMMDPKTFTKGDIVTLSVNCKSEDEIKMHFKKLSEGGKVTMPLDEMFWGATFGMVTDKYGFDWMLNFQKKPMK